MAETINVRNPYFDFLKGIAIIFVVAIHTFGVIYSYETIDIFSLLLRQIMNCAVPIFCASSAYFLSNKEFDFKENRKRFISQFIRVYVPFLFCSLPYLLLDLYKGTGILKPFIKYFSCSYSIYYFVALIIQFYLMLTIFKNHFLKYKVVSFFISFLYLVIYTYFVREKIHLPLILYAGPIFCWLIYFSLGYYFSSNSNKTVKLYIPIILIVITLALCLFESYYFINKMKNLSGSGIKPTAMLFSVTVVILLFDCNLSEKYINTKFNVCFTVLGRYSYGIYLIHLYILAIVRKLSYNSRFSVLGWGLLTFVVILTTFVILWIVRRISKKIGKYCFGIV